jgi:hypothetical protein
VNFQSESSGNSCSDLLSQNMRCLLKENFAGRRVAQMVWVCLCTFKNRRFIPLVQLLRISGKRAHGGTRQKYECEGIPQEPF